MHIYSPPKRTKIIATLGPACDDREILKAIINKGVDLIRLNFSHGNAEEHKKRASMIRELTKETGRQVGILADLQGPKIRIARFKQGKVDLKENQTFILDINLGCDQGDEKSVGIDYKGLVSDVSKDDVLLLNDGHIILQVNHVSSSKITTSVLVGGELSNNKGINRQGGGLSAKFLTDKDREDLKTAIKIEADYIAVSFPRSGDDIHEARKLINQANGQAGIIAKIERSEAISDIDNIILASDAIMIARGDLGVEIGDAELPSVQKSIIRRCRDLDRAVITATQMMDSMIENIIPTRAEVFDVANAVLDGTDAVMLSAETAVGKHPEKVIEATARICRGAEKNPLTQVSKHRLECKFQKVDEAIAMAVMYTANHLNIRAIIALTESGSTTLYMSRIRSGIPIYALTRHIATQRKITLYRGVYPIHFDVTQISQIAINQAAVDLLKDLDLVKTGDLVILTKGDYMGVHGGTNAMKIIKVL